MLPRPRFVARIALLGSATLAAGCAEAAPGPPWPVDVAGGTRILAVTGRHMTQLEGVGALVDTALESFYDMEGGLLDSVARRPPSGPDVVVASPPEAGHLGVSSHEEAS